MVPFLLGALALALVAVFGRVLDCAFCVCMFVIPLLILWPDLCCFYGLDAVMLLWFGLCVCLPCLLL
jgi:hypothetical protein